MSGGKGVKKMHTYTFELAHPLKLHKVVPVSSFRLKLVGRAKERDRETKRGKRNSNMGCRAAVFSINLDIEWICATAYIWGNRPMLDTFAPRRIEKSLWLESCFCFYARTSAPWGGSAAAAPALSHPRSERRTRPLSNP